MGPVGPGFMSKNRVKLIKLIGEDEALRLIVQENDRENNAGNTG